MALLFVANFNLIFYLLKPSKYTGAFFYYYYYLLYFYYYDYCSICCLHSEHRLMLRCYSNIENYQSLENSTKYWWQFLSEVEFEFSV